MLGLKLNKHVRDTLSVARESGERADIAQAARVTQRFGNAVCAYRIPGSVFGGVSSERRCLELGCSLCDWVGWVTKARKETGAWGEEAAAQTALRAGARIVARNVRCRQGEIDLIFRHRGVLVFAEVKTRRGIRYGSGLEAVTLRKQRRIVSTARLYALKHGLDLGEIRSRFDVFEVRPGPDVRWVVNAFDVS